MAYKVRKVPDNFNESHKISIAVYSAIFCCGITVVVTLLVPEGGTSFQKEMIVALGALSPCVTLVGVLYWHKCWQVIFGEQSATSREPELKLEPRFGSLS